MSQSILLAFTIALQFWIKFGFRLLALKTLHWLSVSADSEPKAAKGIFFTFSSLLLFFFSYFIIFMFIVPGLDKRSVATGFPELKPDNNLEIVSGSLHKSYIHYE